MGCLLSRQETYDSRYIERSKILHRNKNGKIMNDKDKEAFEKWYSKETSDVLWEDSNGDEIVIKSWQAACEYKQKEIDELKNVTHWTVEQDGRVTRHISIAEIEKLQAENAKLRECVEFYADKKSWDRGVCIGDGQFEHIGDGPNCNYFGGKRARQVLKELGGK